MKINLNFQQWIAVLLLVFLGFSFCGSPIAGSAVFVNNEENLGSIIIVYLSNHQVANPAVAYNSLHDEYLVVWQNIWGTRRVFAQRISSTGQPLGDTFNIVFGLTIDNYDRFEPSVAYDPTNDQYLVVFTHDFSGDGSDYDIQGRFIPWSGPAFDLPVFPVCTWGSDQWNPQAVFNPDQGEFMVVWTNTASGQPADIGAGRINHDTGAIVQTFTVSSGTEDRITPDIAYNRTRSEYLVVWDRVGSTHDIYAQRLTGTGAAQGNEFAVAFSSRHEEIPTVAASQLADQYLVGYQSVTPLATDYDVYVRYVSGDGVPGSDYLVYGTLMPEVEIEASSFSNSQDYLLTWQKMNADGLYSIMGRMLHPPPEGFEDPFLICPTGLESDRLTPASASGKVNFLVTWVHDRDGTAYQDVRGRFFWPYRTFLPMVSK